MHWRKKPSIQVVGLAGQRMQIEFSGSTRSDHRPRSMGPMHLVPLQICAAVHSQNAVRSDQLLRRRALM